LVYLRISSASRCENARWRTRLWLVTVVDSSMSTARNASMARCGFEADWAVIVKSGPRSDNEGFGRPAAS
jgi:hypothetical protein